MNDYRNMLFPYAYNILGSVEDAKDAIQEVLSRFVTVSKEGIGNEKNYLIRSVINQCINMKNRGKKITREGDVWLPEPFSTDEADVNINLREIVSYSLLILLEQLNPRERAVFILKEGFGYSHEEIAEVLSGTVEQSRKLLSRAKARLHPGREPAPVQRSQEGALDKYINAIRGRDIKELESLLTEDIAFFADGGDQVKLVKSICIGMEEVAKLVMSNYHQFQTAHSVTAASINHQPALLYHAGNEIKACQVFGISPEGRIFQISTILDPEKLKRVDKK
jgi:RNA polymerase sigma-70 factor (ECF subfamily)